MDKVDQTSQRPSYFELAGEASMRSLIYPAAQTAVVRLVEQHPSLYRLLAYSDELILLVTLLIEEYFLSDWNASFTENYYGMRRSARQDSRLSGRDRILSLAVMSMPYLSGKLDALHLARKSSTTQPTTVFRRRLNDLFVSFFPVAKTVADSVSLAYQIAYLFNKTDFFSPLLHLSGIRIVRITAKDITAQSSHAASQRSKTLALLSAIFLNPRFIPKLIQSMYSMLFKSIKYLIPLSIFAYKYAEWWKANGSSLRKTVTPPPPEPIKPHENGVRVPGNKGDCPLCERARVTDTALPSGYVFCYTCVFKYVEMHGCCPVTRISVDLTDFRRIF